jgi:hypothetical protein
VKKKNIAKFGVPVLLLVSISECGMVVGSNADIITTETTQTLEVPSKTLGVLDMIIRNQQFKRLDVEVIEVAPWLKPKMQSIKISDTDLIEILRNVGFEGYGLKMAWAIIQQESTSRIYAHNRNRSTGDNSYGLFQINMIDAIGPARLKEYGLSKNEELFDPLTNAKVAFDISNGGLNWGAWTTHGSAKSTVYQFPG